MRLQCWIPFVVGLVLLAALMAGCSSTYRGSTLDLAPAGAVSVCTERFGPYETLPVVVNGRPGRVIVDSGSASSVFSSTWQDASNESRALDVRVTLGRSRVNLAIAWMVDSPFSNPKGINGLLGADVLYDLDYYRQPGLVTFSPRPLHCGGRIIRLRDGGSRRPFLDDVRIGELALRNVLLDSGAVDVVLSPATAALLPEAVRTGAREVGFCTFDGCQESGAYTTTVPEVCVAGSCEQSVSVKWPAWDAVGLSWLNRHSYIISLRRMELEVCE